MYTDTSPAITSSTEVLEGLSGVRDQMRVLERGLVVLAVEWAKHHPGPTGAMPVLGSPIAPYDHQRAFDELAASGAISFDDDAVSNFAIAVGMTEYSARKLIRESIMLVHFLPRVWSRVLSGGLDVWRARALAGDCFGLTYKAMEFVDTHASTTSARVTTTSRARLIALARKTHMPEVEQSREEELKAARTAEVLVHQQEQGLVPVQALLDLPDALALEAAITTGAQALAEAGSDAPLNVRRSWALGDIARAATAGSTLFSASSPGCGCDCHPSRPRWNGRGSPPIAIKVFIHLDQQAISGTPIPSTKPNSVQRLLPPPYSPPGSVSGTTIPGTLVCTPESIREWFTRPTLAGAHAPRISVRPTLDRRQEIDSGSYQPTERIHEHVSLSYDSCIFPFCTRPVHACDADHTIPWQEEGAGGATCTCNLAPLCRTHHRLKTHGDNAPRENGAHTTWRYTNLGDGEHYWSGPGDWAFLRTKNGTFDVSISGFGGAPRPSMPLTPTLGDDTQRADTEHLIARLLRKASLTRGVHEMETSPMWSVPSRKDDGEPPDYWDEDGEYIGPTTFLMVESPFPLVS